MSEWTTLFRHSTKDMLAILCIRWRRVVIEVGESRLWCVYSSYPAYLNQCKLLLQQTKTRALLCYEMGVATLRE